MHARSLSSLRAQLECGSIIKGGHTQGKRPFALCVRIGFENERHNYSSSHASRLRQSVLFSRTCMPAKVAMAAAQKLPPMTTTSLPCQNYRYVWVCVN
jgi:hypothetical protein